MINDNTMFISSTSSDLKVHREQLIFALHKLRQRIEAMEYFGARPQAPLDECIKTLNKANLVVLILGMRYGSVDHHGVSITQREYEAAVESNKIIFSYLIDEDEHPLLPKHVDKGEDAEKLAAFKKRINDHHIRGYFSSPEDLAVKVITDIVRYTAEQDSTVDEKDHLEFANNLPTMLIEAGYSTGMLVNEFDLGSAINTQADGSIQIKNTLLRNTVVASHIAINLSKGNYNILKGLITFDKPVWDLIVLLSNHYGIDSASMARFIESTNDPVHVRLLAGIAGDIKLYECTEAICKKTLSSSSFYQLFREQQAPATPLEDVFKGALITLGKQERATIEKYLDLAKSRKHWKAKALFENVLKKCAG